MIFLICIFIFIATTIILKNKDCSDEIIGVFIALSVFCTVFTITYIVVGLNVYPSLIAQREEVITLKSEIENVRKAWYPNVNKNSLIAGSLDNFKQSTVLSEYIIEYASKKARYNANLNRNIVYKSKFIFWWFGVSAFISKDIFSLEPLD